MFARFKTPEGKEVNVVPYKVIGLSEVDNGTLITLEGGNHVIVGDSIRKTRSTLTKIAYPVSSPASNDEAPVADATEAA